MLVKSKTKTKQMKIVTKRTIAANTYTPWRTLAR